MAVVGRDRSAKILDIYAIGRADRHDPRARSLDDVADADALADLDQVSRRHDDVPAGRKGAADQEERRGVRRGDRRALRIGQGAQHPLAGLCSAVGAGCSRWRCAGGLQQAFARRGSERRVAPAGVDDDPRRVDVVARGRALGSGVRGSHAGDRFRGIDCRMRRPTGQSLAHRFGEHRPAQEFAQLNHRRLLQHQIDGRRMVAFRAGRRRAAGRLLPAAIKHPLERQPSLSGQLEQCRGIGDFNLACGARIDAWLGTFAGARMRPTIDGKSRFRALMLKLASSRRLVR